MSIESRLARGDDPKDVAELFGIDVKDLPKPPKKAAKKKAK